jgi:hypothetical protein
MVEEQKYHMQQQLAEMRQLLRKNGVNAASPPPSPVMKPSLFKDTRIKEETDDLPSLFDSSRTHTVDPRASLTPAPKETSENLDDLDLAQHPAVVLCGLPCQSMDSAASPASSVSDGTFNNLFNCDNTTLPTLSFFEEGFTASTGNVDADNVQVDNMADFDPDLPTQANLDDFTFGNDDNQHDEFTFDFGTSNDTIVDFSHESAATSSHLQPCIGASS